MCKISSEENDFSLGICWTMDVDNSVGVAICDEIHQFHVNKTNEHIWMHFK